MAEEAQEVAAEEVPPTNEAEEAEETGDQVENEEEATNSDEDADDTGEPPRKDKGVGKRINELTREKYEAKREAEYWRMKAEEVAQQRTSQTNSAEYWEQLAAMPEAPNPDQFRTFEAYQMALSAFSNQVQEYGRERERSIEQSRREAAEAKKTWVEREDAARGKLADFDSVVYPLLESPAIAHNPALGEALLASPKGAEVLYHLGKNPSEAYRIAQLPPAACAREIGRIEARLESQQTKSGAPTPPRPVAPKASKAGLRDDMPLDEWLRERNKQVYGSRR